MVARHFNSKILLFGEYTLLKGSAGLAIPYPLFSGYLVQPHSSKLLNVKHCNSNEVLKKMAIALSKNLLLTNSNGIQQLFEDVSSGLYFESSIPSSYGIGSSGTLVAAIYHKYFTALTDQTLSNSQLHEIKNQLATIESFFHGKSSGIDPLVSYLNQPILLNWKSNHNKIATPTNIQIFLIDTGKPSSTKDYIKIFDQEFDESHEQLNQFIALNNHCINSFLNNSTDLLDCIISLCVLEQTILPQMFIIDTPLQNLILKYKNKFNVKLSGSGGGGYLLGFATTEIFETLANELNQNKIQIALVNDIQGNLISID